MKKTVLCALMAATVATAAADIYEYEPGPFDKILIRADMDVVYRNVPDSAGFVRYESATDFSEKIEVSCQKGKLAIIDKLTEEEYGPLPKLYLYSDYLLSAVNEGTGTMVLDLAMSTPTLSVKLVGNGKIICNDVNTTEFSANIVTGNGTIVADGKCRKAKFTLTGTGVIQADRLLADEVRCSVLGTGTIGCRPLETLDVRGVGTTKVYYYGDPAVKKVGGAKLEQMKDPAAEEKAEEESALPEREEIQPEVKKVETLSEPSEETEFDD